MRLNSLQSPRLLDRQLCAGSGLRYGGLKRQKNKSLLYIFFVFQVRDIQPPLVTGCPHSKTVFLEPGEVKIYTKTHTKPMSQLVSKIL